MFSKVKSRRAKKHQSFQRYPLFVFQPSLFAYQNSVIEEFVSNVEMPNMMKLTSKHGQIHTLYNAILRIARNFLETRENIKIFDPSILPYKFGLIFKMADSKKAHFSKSPILKIFSRKFLRWVLGLVGLNDAKGIDVPQRIWPFFLLHSHENQPKFTWQNGWVEILMFTLVSRKFLAMRNIALYSV